MSRITSFAEWVLRLPFIWGGLASLAFYASISQGLLDHPLIIRYFASHVILTTTTVMFFIGVAALLMRWVSVGTQLVTLGRDLLSPIPEGGQPLSDVAPLLEELDQLPEYMQQTYAVGRLRSALNHLRRKSTLEDLEPHLRHLEEADLGTMSSGYGMARTIIWAIPILGFLGTVIGITLSIAKLSPEKLESSLTEVTSGLGVAFDTTALALALSMGLMFLKFFVEGVEERLLAKVDARTSEELIGRFYATDPYADQNVATIRRMSEQVIEAVELMTARQAQLWRSTVDESHRHWAEIATSAGEMLETTFTRTVHTGLAEHANTLRLSTDRHAEVLAENARRIAGTLQEGAAGLLQQATSSTTELLSTTGARVSELMRSMDESSRQLLQAMSEGSSAQVEQLAAAVEAQSASLSDQVERLTAATDGHATTLGESTERLTHSLTRNAREHARLLQESGDQQVGLLHDGMQQHAQTLHQGAVELSIRLREGLEKMAELLVEALHSHGESLAHSEEELAQENRRHLSEVEAALGEAMVLSAERQENLIERSEQLLESMHQALVDASQATVSQQRELARQGEILLQAVEATGQVKALEEALNSNLDSLARTHQFEEILFNLSATLQLLTTRVGAAPGSGSGARSATTKNVRADAA